MGKCPNGVSVLYRDSNGRSLWVRRKDPDRLGIRRWELPTGGVELGESFEEAAVREFLEETGYSINAGELVLVGTFGQKVRMEDGVIPMDGTMLFYEIGRVSGELISQPNEEVCEAAYMGLDEIWCLKERDQTNIASVRLLLHKLRCEAGLATQPLSGIKLAYKIEEVIEDAILHAAITV